MFGTGFSELRKFTLPGVSDSWLVGEDERVSGQQPQEAVQSAQTGSLVTLLSPLATFKDWVGLVRGLGERWKCGSGIGPHVSLLVLFSSSEVYAYSCSACRRTCQSQYSTEEAVLYIYSRVRWSPILPVVLQ